MKKIIAISVLFMLILTGCKNTNNKENISDNNEADIRFINYDTNCYGNGMIYGNNPAMFLDFDNMKISPLMRQILTMRCVDCWGILTALT